MTPLIPKLLPFEPVLSSQPPYFLMLFLQQRIMLSTLNLLALLRLPQPPHCKLFLHFHFLLIFGRSQPSLGSLFFLLTPSWKLPFHSFTSLALLQWWRSVSLASTSSTLVLVATAGTLAHLLLHCLHSLLFTEVFDEVFLFALVSGFTTAFAVSLTPGSSVQDEAAFMCVALESGFRTHFHRRELESSKAC